MNALHALAAGREERIVLHPNRSLSPRAMLLLFLGLAAASAVLALLFLARGAWPVPAFLLLELIAVGAVLCLLRRHRQDCELILLGGDRIRIVRRERYRETCHELPRPWARVTVEKAGTASHTPRVLIRSHGREVEVGAQLGEAERLALAWRLRQALMHSNHEGHDERRGR